MWRIFYTKYFQLHLLKPWVLKEVTEAPVKEGSGEEEGSGGSEDGSSNELKEARSVDRPAR